ncbi:hornerin-like isoform X1 [Oncorhynchus nerka]|uniref:hornerin-like isoform X1 n=1 Tax=Oncorhynchus nerka TaxID=8023 RepID=UPI0031B8A66D
MATPLNDPTGQRGSSGQRGRSSGQRDRSSGQRDRSSGQRDRSSGQRDRSSGQRDRSSGQRDRSSGQRDRSSGQRDRSSGQRDRGSGASGLRGSGASGLRGSGASGLRGSGSGAGQAGGSGSGAGQAGRSGRRLRQRRRTGGRLQQRRRTGGTTCREETERQPGAWGCHRNHQAGETFRRLGVRRSLKDWAVGEHWSSGAQPWHHFPRLDNYSSPDPPECRHRLNRAVGKHGRSSAYYTHLSLWLHSHICPARAERRQRTHCTLPAPRRHSTQSRRRITWTKTAYRRPDPLSRHHTPWLNAHTRMALNAHTRMALSGGCPIAHRAMGTHWRHRALNRITRCLTVMRCLS